MTIEEFKEYAGAKKKLLLEFFYRHMRKKHHILFEEKGKPLGGQWNYDKENRKPFDQHGPGKIPSPLSFEPDEITQEVIGMVQLRFNSHPGALDAFNLLVTHQQAELMLADFIQNRLMNFGVYEDAMWMDNPFLYHSRLSAPLNVKLLSPKACVDKAIKSYQDSRTPINSVEGFVRQILGWREYMRGIYWLYMPEYIEMNFFSHTADVPTFFWDGKTHMQCVSQTMKHILQHGYSHHIHRLMIMGLLAQLLGVHPRKFHEWHMAMYLDAIDWVSLPNTLGMSQYGDGGIVGSKPYCAGGNYINRLSNFCRHCQYEPKKSTGEKACPFTTLYWDFLYRHFDKLKQNPRLRIQMRNVEEKGKSSELKEVLRKAEDIKKQWIR